MRRSAALIAAAALVTAGAACSTLIGLGDIDRVDCAEDCGVDGSLAEASFDGTFDAPRDGAPDTSQGPDVEGFDAGHDGGGTDATSDGGDAAYVDKGVRCGDAATYCKPGMQVCCNSNEKCATDAATCGLTGFLGCDDTADCVTEGLPNDVCCAVLSSGKILGSGCTAPAKCTAADRVLCDPKAAKPCTDGAACNALSGGYSACN
jgi:hypothetical protein